MPIPPDPVLRAAVRWMEQLPGTDIRRCRALFTSHRAFGDLAPSQYDAGLAWLRAVGLVPLNVSDTASAREAVFAAAITGSDVVWFRDAEVLICTEDDLPADAFRASEAIGFTPDRALAQIREVWGNYDVAERQRIGAAGELALIDLLTKAKVGRVDHVAALSDGYGYDIAVHGLHGSHHVETKSTTRRGRLVIHLSRNEYDVSLRDPHWLLVAVRLDAELVPIAVAVVPTTWIRQHVPSDVDPLGRWTSCAIEVPTDVLESGLSRIVGAACTDAPLLLSGAAPWPGG